MKARECKCAIQYLDALYHANVTSCIEFTAKRTENNRSADSTYMYMPVNSIDQKFRELIHTQIECVTLCTFISNYLIIFVFEGKTREILWRSVNSIAYAIKYLYLIERNEKCMISINKRTICKNL